jgi:hypothetical protein
MIARRNAVRKVICSGVCRMCFKTDTGTGYSENEVQHIFPSNDLELTLELTVLGMP